MINAILITVTIIFTVFAQLILKVGADTFYFPSGFTFSEIMKMTALNLSNVYVIGSIVLTLVAGLSWILVVQNMPLSRAYPIMSLNYVSIYILSWLLFNEQLSPFSIAGVVLIVMGTCLLGFK